MLPPSSCFGDGLKAHTVRGEEPGHRVDRALLAGGMQLQVQMVAGDVAGGPHQPDHRVMGDRVADADIDGGEVAVPGPRAVAVPDDDLVPVGAVVPRERDPPRPDRDHRRPGRRVEVDTGVDAGPQVARLAEGRSDVVARERRTPLPGFPDRLTLALLSSLTCPLPVHVTRCSRL